MKNNETLFDDISPLDLARSESKSTLGLRYGAPPFSVLDGRSGEWRKRKNAWIGLGIKSEVGRDANTYHVGQWMEEKAGGSRGNTAGISVFDPALCELMYTWFCPNGGSVVDPFAGGSVRGVVASELGLKYMGIDLRKEQIEANNANALNICGKDNFPEWTEGDSINIGTMLTDKYDFMFSCPPYYDLEVYSDLDGELSALPTYDEFIEAYSIIISEAIGVLKEDRFACFVVANFRGRDGFYSPFVADTIFAFEQAGARLYNEAVLLSPIGSMPTRAAKAFDATRKLCKGHQNVLVFVKGDARKAADACKLSVVNKSI